MIKRVTNQDEYIKYIMERANESSLTAQQLCDFAQVDRATYSRAQRGLTTMTITTALRLLHAIGGDMMLTQSPTYYERQ